MNTPNHIRALQEIVNENEQWLTGDGSPEMKREHFDRDVELSRAVNYWIEIGPNAVAVEEIKDAVGLLSGRLAKGHKSILKLALVHGVIDLARKICDGDNEISDILENWTDYTIAARKEKVLDKAPTMKRFLTKERFIRWCERNGIDAENPNRFIDDDDEKYLLIPEESLSIRSWTRQKRLEGWQTDSNAALQEAIADGVIDGSDKSIRNFRTQMSQLRVSDKGYYDFRNAKV